MRRLPLFAPTSALCLALAFSPALPAGADVAPEVAAVSDAPAGTYHNDPAHSRVIFKVDHIGFSTYIAQFLTVEVELAFDPAAPETMALTARVDPASVETNYPDPDFDFNGFIAGPDFLDAGQFPDITFVSHAIALTGPLTADVTGDLTLHGVTRPLTLQATFNGGYAGHPLDAGGARIGFSARGEFNRSDFGIDLGLPPPGSTLGVGDAVTVEIEMELLNPDAPKP